MTKTRGAARRRPPTGGRGLLEVQRSNDGRTITHGIPNPDPRTGPHVGVVPPPQTPPAPSSHQSLQATHRYPTTKCGWSTGGSEAVTNATDPNDDQVEIRSTGLDSRSDRVVKRFGFTRTEGDAADLTSTEDCPWTGQPAGRQR
jgi:hypothetical protein